MVDAPALFVDEVVVIDTFDTTSVANLEQHPLHPVVEGRGDNLHPVILFRYTPSRNAIGVGTDDFNDAVVFEQYWSGGAVERYACSWPGSSIWLQHSYFC